MRNKPMALFKKNYSTKSDEELMSLLTKGGQSAFDELYERYSRPMLNFFFRLTGNNREKAEDMLHDLFLKVIEKPENFDGTKKFSTWFYTLAGNMVKNEYRSLQTRNEYREQLFHTSNELVELNKEQLDRQLFDLQLQLELEKLEAETRLIFNLRFVEEMSIKQIAEIVDCPEGTVKSRLFYLTKQLSKRLSIYKPELN
ncbi:MAG: RNA polymerase sigma factor [Paludibacter sp.]